MFFSLLTNLFDSIIRRRVSLQYIQEWNVKLYTLQILDYGLADYVAKFEAISEAATKEGNLERALHRMHLDWTEIAFVVNPYRDTGTYIIASIDDIQLLLDDHLIKAQTMKNSLYIKPFVKETLLVTFIILLTNG